MYIYSKQRKIAYKYTTTQFTQNTFLFKILNKRCIIVEYKLCILNAKTIIGDLRVNLSTLISPLNGCVRINVRRRI